MEEPDNDWRMEDVFFVSEDTRLPSGQIAKKGGSQLTRQSVARLNKKKKLFASPCQMRPHCS